MFNSANQTHFCLTLDGQRNDLQVFKLHGSEAAQQSQSPDWLDMAGDMVGKKMGVS